MDAYPQDYVAHNLPLVLLSGLQPDNEYDSKAPARYPLLEEKGTKIVSDFPPLSGAIAEELRRALLAEDGSHRPWKADSPAGAGATSSMRLRFHISIAPSKSQPPLNSPPTSPIVDSSDSSSTIPYILHSPISPLSPGSPTFPDGLLTPLWVTKHQDLVPAAALNFFPFSLDPNMNSLRDNQLKIEINSLKNEWTVSGFKTRFLVVLVSEEGVGGYEGEIDDRIAGIRRATNLDQKSIFVIPPDATSTELRDFVQSLFSLLQPSVVEYYRDLSKHARRKRNRSTIPPPTAPPTTGTSQTLSLQGWNVRYEFKLGIFAEFRQEMDAACRNYESAYETLFGQEVFETIAGWDPRFNDARLLGDTLAIRIMRCLFWTGQTTAAVRFWVDHRIRTNDIVNRRGKGSKNYGWEAWEARWSLVMAELIRRCEIYLSIPEGPGETTLSPLIFLPPEKSISVGERVNPWEHLHHQGYWLYRSAKHSMARKSLALQIPTEDRLSPGQLPASQLANKSYLYDTYLVPETYLEYPQSGQGGTNHSEIILLALKAAVEEFSKRNQQRQVERLSLEIAQEYMRNASWKEAFEVLSPLWSTLSWRRSGWWSLMESFGWALRESAARAHETETVLRIDWELANRVFTPRSGWQYDIHGSLENLPAEKPKPSVVLRAEDVVTSLTASVVFENAEGNVGEPLQAQLIISSCAQLTSAPIRLSEVKLVFEGCLRPLKLQSGSANKSDTKSPCLVFSSSLQEVTPTADIHSPTHGLSALVGEADLTIGPSQTKVYNLTCIPREAGEAQIASITMLIEEDRFDLAYVVTHQPIQTAYWWQETNKGPSRRRVGKGRDTTKCRIMPKPPKIRISLPNIKEIYYTNERVLMKIDLHNEEDEGADVSAEIRLFGSPESSAQLQWLDGSSDPMESGTSSPTEAPSHLLTERIGVMERGSHKELIVVLADTQDTAKYALEISAVYHLVSDAQTPIMKTISVDLSFIRPFEANYEFKPCVHPVPWPDFFSVSDELIGDDHATAPGGQVQRWCLNSKLVSFAQEALVIEQMSLKLLTVTGGAVSTIEPEVLVSPESHQINPEELRESNFAVDIQKTSLGDRRPVALNVALDITWHRKADEVENDPDSNHTTTTILEVPRFVAAMGEPRVLASSSTSASLPGLLHLDYTLENPSTHFLTFNLIMEANEQFVFSGPKTTVIQLVPLSRHTVRYNLLPAKRGLWIQPQLVVVDTYFNKTLRVLPTGEMRADKKGILVWVDAED
ncbi:hypothetical protein N7539_004509 [Penicillium diatomitis]|uniref:Uncharacterized protein n=1 Tax=Penicillium diatomitis TaxID=2819901 RepID=A0A9W9XE45_9EURO|nr:uncharacterized protein N7539_004509 [Penicillium diatomitis]KAJ5489619.1 hypothetical protein N7539_004509 [Penicillium diatomitis]